MEHFDWKKTSGESTCLIINSEFLHELLNKALQFLRDTCYEIKTFMLFSTEWNVLFCFEIS